jgi:hypothetical protein
MTGSRRGVAPRIETAAQSRRRIRCEHDVEDDGAIPDVEHTIQRAIVAVIIYHQNLHALAYGEMILPARATMRERLQSSNVSSSPFLHAVPILH